MPRPRAWALARVWRSVIWLCSRRCAPPAPAAPSAAGENAPLEPWHSAIYPPTSNPTPPARPARVAIIGGGISGLAAAHRLAQLAPPCVLRLLESGDRLGGALHTLTGEGGVLEQGADSFLTRDPVVVELCHALGLGADLMPTSSEHRRALVVCRGRLQRVPDGFVLMQPHNLRAVLGSPVLSTPGKLRLLAERFAPRPIPVLDADYDESVASFAARRLGRETFERLVEPLLAGIYVADAARLSLAATMPEFLAAERLHGSLAAARRAARAAGQAVGPATGARYGAFQTLQRGVSSLIAALADALPAGALQLSAPATGVVQEGSGRWRVASSAGSELFDAVILATPAHQAAAMLKAADGELAGMLDSIEAASSVVVTLGYGREQIDHPLDGFGFVAPRVERREILAASFPSVKFAERASGGLTPVRVFLGGALRPELVDQDDASLIAIAERELKSLLGARGAPRTALVARWRQAMPQYHVGHLAKVAAINQRVGSLGGLALAGASYSGVGIPQCVRSGYAAAERIAAQLQAGRSPAAPQPPAP
ncbi:MAG TPA: protoporphyrinogen oxidase [Lacipirellulaceae bacterium]|nr:protoporphyrinogen oxidase [Lacipirellulaceae bacterium]